MAVDPLSPDDRERLMAEPRPRRCRSRRTPRLRAGACRSPTALARVDREARPIYAVWEVTLACDLACRHCGSRAGRARPDELTTDECLDLVRQMAALGVREVTLIGGEAYLREDWLEIVRAIRAHGHDADDDHRRPRHRCRARARRQAGRPGQRQRVARRLAATHDRLRGVRGSHARALAAIDQLRAAGVPVSVNTQINRLSMPELPRAARADRERTARTAGRLQLTVPMGRAADEPEVLLQPYELLELFPLLAQLRERCDELGVRHAAGQQHRLLRAARSSAARLHALRPRRLVRRRSA